jgi:hypothetical protein
MKMQSIALGLAAICLAPLPAQSQRLSPALLHAHAHNDYEHPRPLFDALDHGFCSVEADIYLTNGQLLVAHDPDKLSPQRSLQRLYLDPLQARVKENGGRVLRGGPEFTLLIDLKSDAEKTYAALRPVLEQYADMLTIFRTNATATGAVTVILSGNRPTATVSAEPVRRVAIDGRLPDLDATPSRHLMPLVSDNWPRYFQWRGGGPMPEDDQAKLRQMVSRAHAQGRRIRFWAAPDLPAAWRAFRDAGVDLINTDDLAGLQKFLSSTLPVRPD